MARIRCKAERLSLYLSPHENPFLRFHCDSRCLHRNTRATIASQWKKVHTLPLAQGAGAHWPRRPSWSNHRYREQKVISDFRICTQAWCTWCCFRRFHNSQKENDINYKNPHRGKFSVFVKTRGFSWYTFQYAKKLG